MAQLVGHRPAEQQVTGSILVRVRAWDAGLVPGQGVDKKQLFDASLSHGLCVSLSPSPSLPL